MPAIRPGVRSVLALAAICVLPIILYLPFLTEPFMRDEGLYASVAQLILDGGIPYRDAFDNKPPLIFGIYSFSFILFGENVWAPRLLAAICLSLTTVLVYFQGRLAFSPNGGLIAALAFALSIGIAGFQTNANTEYFLVLPMVGALVAFTLARRTDKAAWYVLAGVLSGLAVMTKQVAIFNFLVLLAVPLIISVRDGGWTAVASRRVVRPLIVMASGFTVAVGAVVAPFIIAGAFGEFFDGVVVYPLSYSGGLSLVDKLGHALWSPVFLMIHAGPWVALAVFGVLFVARDEGNPDRQVLVLWLAACGLGVASTGRFYDHYFVQLLPAMALLVPAGVYFLKHAWGSRWAKVTAMWLLPISAAIPLLISAAIYLQPTAEARHEVKYASGEGVLENNSADLARYLAAVTSEEDYIYNLGFQSEIYFYADRQAPTRFLFDHPFEVEEKYEVAALQDLRADPPAYIVDSAVYEENRLRDANYYPVLIKGFIDENYEYIGRLYYADIYRLANTELEGGR
jgi:4-amino-4-deoxy-L-arabinose transferase-like glycosyltransferase